MEKLLKSELKVRAIRLGIKNGYHGRVISKMRKKDFIDFINESDCIDLTCDDDIPSVNQLKKELQETKKKVNEIQQNAINREREIRRDALNREQNLIRIHEDIINNLLLSFSALNLEESQPVQTEPPIDDNNVPENVLCPVCLIVKVNTVFNCTHVSCSSMLHP